MSKRKLLTVILLAFVTTLMLACAVIFTACGNNETPDDGHNTEQGGENPDDDEPGTDPDDDKDIAVTAVSLNKTSLTLEVGESYTLVVNVSPSNATDKSITWSSTNSSVAAISGGKVTAKSEGTTTITAEAYNGKTATCTVTVNEPASEVIEVTSVSLNKTSLTLEIGESETLTATVLPSNATDKSVTWTSFAQSIATVANGKVTAIGSGTATITATTSNGKTATCTVTVTNPYADFSFTLSGNGYALTGYSGMDTEVVVPAKYMGKAVTVINSRAFYDCSFITKITLPDTLKEIGDQAFGYCTSLQTIEIPACTRILDGVFLGCTSLQEVTFPEGVIALGDNLFTNCNALQKVTVLSGNVAQNTFAGCTNLKEIIIGENIASVAQGAFEACTSLQYLTLPRVDENELFTEYYFGLTSVKYILEGTGSNDLYPDKVKGYTVNSGGTSYILQIPTSDAKWYYQGNGITVDGKYYGYSKKPVEVSEWEDCYEITVNVRYKKPKEWSADFYYTPNSSLKKLTITNQLISIYDDVFESCGFEIDVKEKFSVESISVIGETEIYLDEFSLDDYVLRVRHTDGWTEDLPLADHLSEADKEMLQQSGSHTLTISYEGHSCEFAIKLNLHTFDSAVMEDMTVLADGSAKYLQVTGIPEDTEIIWENNGQTEVGEYTVTATLKRPYYEDKILTAHLYIRQAQYDITYVLGIEEAENTNPDAYTFGEGLTLSSPTSGAWEFLGWYADADFTKKVTEVSAEEYGNKTFYARWRTIFVYENGTIIGLTDFGQKQYDSGNLKEISIPSEINGQTITGIGNTVFMGKSKLTSVTIGNGVASIGECAFYNCSGLTNVTIPDSVENIGYGAFYSCTMLMSVEIGDGVTSISSNTFYGCSSLISVIIPDSITSIGQAAFSQCSKLTNVTMGNSVKSIGNEAFKGCLSLMSIIIPVGVTNIGDYAFEGCSSLTSVNG